MRADGPSRSSLGCPKAWRTSTRDAYSSSANFLTEPGLRASRLRHVRSTRRPWVGKADDPADQRQFLRRTVSELVLRAVERADPSRRRVTTENLWTTDGVRILEPPQEGREIAARPGSRLTARLKGSWICRARGPGHQRLREVRSVFEVRFRRRGDVNRLADLFRFSWEMVSADGVVVAAV